MEIYAEIRTCRGYFLWTESVNLSFSLWSLLNEYSESEDWNLLYWDRSKAFFFFLPHQTPFDFILTFPTTNVVDSRENNKILLAEEKNVIT